MARKFTNKTFAVLFINFRAIEEDSSSSNDLFLNAHEYHLTTKMFYFLTVLFDIICAFGIVLNQAKENCI